MLLPQLMAGQLRFSASCRMLSVSLLLGRVAAGAARVRPPLPPPCTLVAAQPLAAFELRRAQYSTGSGGGRLPPRALLGDDSRFVRRGDKSTPDSAWSDMLSPKEYDILRGRGTEAPHSGAYNQTTQAGIYQCAGCRQPLYTSDTKFYSACGWPAFYEELPGAVERHSDNSMGLRRTEITCRHCGGHLGHEFRGEGFPTPTDSRHCVNSAAIKLVEMEVPEELKSRNHVLDALRWSGEGEQ